MRQLFLHLGTHKTGSSLIQYALRRSEHTLRELGVRPVVGDESDEFLRSIDYAAIEKRWVDDASVVVFSNENFLLVDDPARLERVKEIRDTALGAGFDVTTIIYLRPAIEFIPSMWAQYVKIGSLHWGTFQLDKFVDTFDYSVILRSVIELQSECKTIVRPFVPSLMRRQDILEDFFAAVGVSPDGIDLSDIPESLNVTPSRRQTDLARVYNMNQRPGEVARRHHVQLLNSFLRVSNTGNREPSVAETTTKTQLQSMCDRYAETEAALTDGLVDSRLTLAGRLADAPDTYHPDIPDGAVDLYLQNMMILSTIERQAAVPSGTIPSRWSGLHRRTSAQRR